MNNLHNSHPNTFAKKSEGNQPIVSSIPTVPDTEKRKPYNPDESDLKLRNPGTARANIAPDQNHPNGTTHKDWSKKHSRETVLQQHCDFFDCDRDGILWPTDTYIGFQKLGFNFLLCILAAFIIHVNFAYPTGSSWLPDPFFRIHIPRIHRASHGSDSGTYDQEGRFVPQKFEEIFTKYAEGRDYVTVWDVVEMGKGQRNVNDPIGWGGFVFEWLATYLLLWPRDGRMMKEDIRGVFDGSIFYKIAERRGKGRGWGE
ncbi:Caleosin-domain-containing protein [Periconia macrospinosa]|uniref:Caleosin-domain-containing protein n=1 Tax=Periconia macrospinosa TaxID=97972 RepID=A0A2V1D7D8_9PLEO|nr:Caleosin-domain-containing protein [Periconia macrospinosa]